MTDQPSSQRLHENLESPHSGRLTTTAFAIYVVAFFLVWSLRATVFIHIDEGIESTVWKSVYSNSIKS